MSGVLYWEYYIDVNEESKAYPKVKEVVGRLLEGDCKSVNLERLRGTDVYSARLNKKHRLLLTTLERGGRRYLVVLEVVWEHDYQKSRFLRGNSVLANYLQGFEGYEFDAVDSFDLEKAELSAGSSSWSPVSLHGERWIEFDTCQDEARFSELPLLVNGKAGSGKSLIALSMLRNRLCYRPLDACQPFSILYVSKSPALVNEMRSTFESGGSDACVHFLSYADLLAREDERIAALREELEPEVWTAVQLNDELSHERIANKSFFAKWLAVYGKIHGKTLSGGQPSSAVLAQEFSILSAYDEESYVKLGKKRSHFAAEGDKRWVYQAYQAYLKAVVSQNKVSLSFSGGREQGSYDFVVVDESQDLSSSQLQHLLDLAKEGQVVFLFDGNQNLKNGHSIKECIKDLCYARNFEVTIKELSRSYRCGSSILRVTNVAIRQKHAFLGLTDKDEVPEIEIPRLAPEGAVGLMADEEALEAYIHANEGRSDFAIIAPLEKIAYLMARFPRIPLILTPEQCKGLEYRRVLVWEPYSSASFVEANRQLAQGKVSEGKTHRAKAHEVQEDVSLAPAFNGIVTAFSRATDELMIYQPETRNNKHLLAPLKEEVARIQTQPDSKRVAAAAEPSSATEWQKEYERHLTLGHIDVAQRILEVAIEIPQALPSAAAAPIVQAAAAAAEKPIHIPKKQVNKAPTPTAKQACRKPLRAKQARSNQAAAATTTKPSTDNLTAEQREVAGLFKTDKLGNITFYEKACKKLLTKTKKPRKLLFYTPTNLNRGCLFSELVKIEGLLDKNPYKKILQEMTAADLSTSLNGEMPPIYYILIDTKKMTGLINQIREKGLFAQLSKSTLCQQTKVGYSAMYVLVSPFAGRQHLLKELDPQVITSIENKLLFAQVDQIIKQKSPLYDRVFGKKVSIFNLLFYTEENLDFLDKLFQKNNEFIKLISPNQFFFEEASYYFSPFTVLLMTPSMTIYLKKILENNPSLLKAMTMELLLKERTNDLLDVIEDGKFPAEYLLKRGTYTDFSKVSDSPTMTYFKMLVLQESKTGILRFLLEKKPSLGEEIIAASMHSNEEKQETPLGYLLHSEMGLTVLKCILKQNSKGANTLLPDFFEQLFDEQTMNERSFFRTRVQNDPELCALLMRNEGLMTVLGEKYFGDSGALAQLAKDDFDEEARLGHQVRMLFNVNGVPDEVLSQQLLKSSNRPIDVLFTVDTDHSRGCLFSYLLMYHSHIINSLPEDVLTAIRPEHLTITWRDASPPIDIILLYAKSDSRLMKHLFEKGPEGKSLFQLISHEILQDSSKNEYLLGIITENGSVASQMLKQLMEHDQWIDGITATNLFSVYPNESMADSKRYWGEKYSLFSLLCLTEEGILLLHKLLERQKALIPLIPDEVFFNESASFYFSPFAVMLMTPIMAPLLKTILVENPSILSQMDSLLLFNGMDNSVVSIMEMAPNIFSRGINHFSKVSTHHKVTYFYLLALQEKETGLLGFILNLKPDIAMLLTSKELCTVNHANAPGHFELDVKLTALYHLTISERGLDVLKQLFMNNSALLKSLLPSYMAYLHAAQTLEERELFRNKLHEDKAFSSLFNGFPELDNVIKSLYIDPAQSQSNGVESLTTSVPIIAYASNPHAFYATGELAKENKAPVKTFEI